MLIDLPLYIHQPSGKSHYRYRRKVPLPLRPILGKTEIILALGKTQAEALRRYPKVHAQAEQQLAAAIMESPLRSTPQ